MRIDATVWWAGFVLVLATVYLVAMWLGHKRMISTRCVLLGHKFTFMLGDYHYDSDTCRRCRFPENIPR